MGSKARPPQPTADDEPMPGWQGDQIGRIFVRRVTITLGTFVKITEIAQTICLLFSTVKALYYFPPKMDWATCWATFSQTHLVTLLVG
jgi:hypothetical protein